jgi:predicted O-methyltransferase YrrM
MLFKKPSIKTLLPPPVDAAHGEYSMILSMHDEPSSPTPTLLNLSLKAIDKAQHVRLDDIASRLEKPPYYPNIWPGEHYKLLAGIVQALDPKVVVEIGTATGLSALSLKKYMADDAKLTTFDIVSWKDLPSNLLVPADFADGRLEQYTDDLSNPEMIQKHRDLLQSADLIFIDATHDGELEKTVMENFRSLLFQTKPYILFDDIRVWTMLKMWREIELPKIDLTSFGHWSGTGLVEWS